MTDLPHIYMILCSKILSFILHCTNITVMHLHVDHINMQSMNKTANAILSFILLAHTCWEPLHYTQLSMNKTATVIPGFFLLVEKPGMLSRFYFTCISRFLSTQ